jgi:hypothetical protein
LVGTHISVLLWWTLEWVNAMPLTYTFLHVLSSFHVILRAGPVVSTSDEPA